jgi:glycosyltransferase involved in cell wall biosynthesis
MTGIAVVLVALPLVLAGYCWVAYPLLLAAVRRGRDREPPRTDAETLPQITVVIAAYNAGRHLRATLDSILAEGYPEQRRRIIVVSDGSEDDTVHIARSMHRHNVRIREVRRRVGKTAAENIIAGQVRTDIVVCIDANVHVEPGAIRALVDALQSPAIGVASGTDVLVGVDGALTGGEGYYTRHEMQVRDAESGWCGIIGASGCFYALRRWLYCVPLPATLTRDFASVLLARRAGLLSVAVPRARCRIAVTTSGNSEYARKVRTILQGLHTLVYFRDLLNPIRYGRFAFALFSHKVCRWLMPLSLPMAGISAIYLLAQKPGLAIATCVSGSILMVTAMTKRAPLRLLAYGLLVQTATMSAWLRFMRRQRIVKWIPTARSIPGVHTTG